MTGITANILTAETSPSPWRSWHFAVLTLLALAAIYVGRQPLEAIYHTASTDEESSHIFLVLIAVPWLVMARWDDLKKCRPIGTWVGPLILAAGWASAVYGNDIRDKEFWYFGAILMFIGACFSVLGREVLWRALPAVAALGFLIPVPGLIRLKVAVPLQTVMAYLTEQVAMIMGMQVTRWRNLLLINDQQVEIAEACNGLRMAFGLFMVAFVFAFALPLKTWVRVVIIAAAPLVALACNVVRMVPTVWIFGHATPKFAEAFHDWAGWLMIPLAFGFLLGFVRLLRWLGLSLERPAARFKPQAAGAPSVMIASVAVCAMLLLGAQYSLGARQPSQHVETHYERVRSLADNAPLVIGDWAGKDTELPAPAIKLLQPNCVISRSFTNLRSGRSVSFVLIHTRYATNMDFHYPPNCYKYTGWEAGPTRNFSLLVNGLDVPLAEYAFSRRRFNRRDEILVENFMFLPSGLTADIGPMEALAADPQRRFLGAGQVQFVFDPSFPEEDRRSAMTEILQAHLPIIKEVLEGVKP